MPTSGGTCLSARSFNRLGDPAGDPLALKPPILAPGLSQGTAITTSARTWEGPKSPLAGGIKEASVGGLRGHKLAKQGIGI